MAYSELFESGLKSISFVSSSTNISSVFDLSANLLKTSPSANDWNRNGTTSGSPGVNLNVGDVVRRVCAYDGSAACVPMERVVGVAGCRSVAVEEVLSLLICEAVSVSLTTGSVCMSVPFVSVK